MADVLFYSTGEIFWVTDPPENRSEHIGVRPVFPPVPPDRFFTYARAARMLEARGHRVIGAYGRHREAHRNARAAGAAGDPEWLALADHPRADRLVLVLIATEQPGDRFGPMPFTAEEQEAFRAFRARGGGTYVMWDHGPLGYASLDTLGLAGPIEPEPAEPLRPDVVHSLDSTDSPRTRIQGVRMTADGPVPVDVELSLGPPAGYLQKIVPAELAAAATSRKLAEADAALEARTEAAAQALAGQRAAVVAELDQVAADAAAELVKRVSGLDVSNDEAANAVKKVAA